ncbi:MAG: ABC transporter ATP-binding protein [Parachlamydia sp.]|nr:ABC transporter ATP-binding protein [Parachlamydia sp.]
MSLTSGSILKMLLDIQDLCLSFDHRETVKNVSFAIHSGETVALVGASGSGKSTTAQSILLPTGATTSGSILFQGEDLLKKSQKEMRSIRGNKIGIIFQDPASSLNPTLTIGEQLIEAQRCHLPVSRREAKNRALELLKSVGIADPALRANQYSFELSGGMRQRAMIAMAISCDPLLLIADEPTTALDLTVQAQILSLLKSIQQAKGLALLFITHDLGIVAGISDRILVMHEGRIVESGSCDEIFYSARHPYTQQLLKNASKSETPRTPASNQKPCFVASQLSKQYHIGKNKLTAVSPLDLTIYQGETLGLVGESGCGKSTLGKLVAGLIDPTEGTLYYQGIDLRRHKLPRRIQILFQNPYGSLNPRMTVEKILTEPFAIHRDLHRKEPSDMLDEVGLAHELLKRYPHQLSGGQRQRIALARILAVDPEFIICDEPLSSLDAVSQRQVMELLKKLHKEKGLTYLFITHDLNAVQEIADRVAVMYLGQLMELSDTITLFQSPAHPYTQALLSATLQPDPRSERIKKPLLLSGDPPSPLHPPPGCPFQTRCPHALEICKTTPAPLVQLSEKRQCRCHLKIR